MGIKLELKAGSFSGHVFPVSLDVAYGPDPVSRASRASDDAAVVEANVYMFFDEGVVQLMAGSISPAGTHTPGTGVITWTNQTLTPGPGWKKYAASFQWIDFREPQTAINGALTVGVGGVYTAQALFVSRPPAVAGLKIKE